MSNVIGLSEKHEANLRKLAAYLKGGELKAQFDIRFFTGVDGDHHQCGTVGCAVGHGPYAGIAKSSNETWRAYSHRAFMPRSNAQCWAWCFASDWFYADPTFKGAADRIEWVLENGLPQDWIAQMDGDAPLCYREPTHA